MHTAQVCQPLAMRPPNADAFAATGSMWNGCGSNCLAKSMISASVKVWRPISTVSPTLKSSQYSGIAQVSRINRAMVSRRQNVGGATRPRMAAPSHAAHGFETQRAAERRPVPRPDEPAARGLERSAGAAEPGAAARRAAALLPAGAAPAPAAAVRHGRGAGAAARGGGADAAARRLPAGVRALRHDARAGPLGGEPRGALAGRRSARRLPQLQH